MGEKQPWSHQGQCRRAGCAPGAEQKLPAVLERPMVESTLSPWSGVAAACGYLSSVVLKGWPHGTEPCWSSSWRALICKKPMQDQFGKNCIL